MRLEKHGIVALLQNDVGEFLLLEDATRPMRGHWAPPHGTCEDIDATEEDTVVRELMEETSIVVQPIRKLHTQPADVRIATVSFWLVRAVGSRVVRRNQDSSADGWFDLTRLFELNLYPGARSFFCMLAANEIRL